MKNSENMGKEDEIDLRDIFLIFIKRKWWFIGTFLVILVAGLLYTFIKPADYLLTYQMEVKENYSNSYLSELYPNYEKELNYVSLINVPVIFKSVSVLKQLEGIDEDIDYNRLLKPESEAVKISLNENTSIFNISVSDPDYSLANKIAKTLIVSFEELIRDREKIIFDEVLSKIDDDIEGLQDENNNYKDTIIASLEGEVDRLYAELDKYIVDYNVGLYDELEENKNSENVSFYNVIIPPNDISDEISKIQEEISLYRKKILENESKIIDLNNLRGGLLKDEDIILDRISLLSDTPFYSMESNRIRNMAIVLVLSIMIGVIVVFVANSLQGLRNDKKKSK